LKQAIFAYVNHTQIRFWNKQGNQDHIIELWDHF